MPEQRESCCARCGEDLFVPAVAAVGAASFCRACRMVPPAFVRAVSAGVYEGSMRGAIHALKYERIAPLARELGLRLAEAIASLAEEVPDGMLMIPVPLYRGRMAERGFNQARVLGYEALRQLRRSHPAWRLELSSKVLMRQKATQSQAGLTPRQRRLNLRGAFFVSDMEAVQGRDVLLIDDIYTTGATARACSRMLMEAGAASVRVATLARAQRRVPLAVRDARMFTKLVLPEEDAAKAVRLPYVH